MKLNVLIACAALTVTGLAVPALASPAQTTDTIKVCVKKKSGAMRSVTSRKACHKGERFLKLQATSGPSLRNVHVININCNMSAEAGAATTGSDPIVRTVTIPTADGNTSIVVTCGDSAGAS